VAAFPLVSDDPLPFVDDAVWHRRVGGTVGNVASRDSRTDIGEAPPCPLEQSARVSPQKFD